MILGMARRGAGVEVIGLITIITMLLHTVITRLAEEAQPEETIILPLPVDPVLQEVLITQVIEHLLQERVREGPVQPELLLHGTAR